jgi:hypothetical protein
MDIATIVMPAGDARAKLEAYRAIGPDKRTALDEAAMAGFKALASGRPVIDLAVAMKGAGLNDQGLPRLAVARADEESIGWATSTTPRYVEGRQTWAPDGGGQFGPRIQVRGKLQRASRIRRFPPGTFDPARARRGHDFAAVVPPIPPEHRPAAALRHFHVLWEAVWEPAPPADPMLLRHLGGMLYVVLAEWDLTPLEQAVLRGRILGQI